MATLKEPFALDRSLNTTEVTPRNIADVLAEGLSHITGRTASEVEYDNTESELTADNVQDAIDELSERPTLPSVDIQTAVDEFSTYNGGILDSLKVSLSPNQDLHGYSEPWVGGAGKNKLPLPVAETKNGVTLTHNSDGSITLTGTASVNTYFDFFPNGGFNSSEYSGYKVYLNNSGVSPSVNTIMFRISGSDRVSLQDIVGNGTAINTSADGLYFAIRISTGYNTNGCTFKPMMIAPDETDPTFEPYENKCPISAHTQAKLEQRGKNKINATDKHFDANSNKNELLQSNLNLKAGTYTLSFDISNNVTVTRNRPLYVINGANTYAPSDYTSQGRGSWTFTLSADSTVTFYWWISANTSAVDVKNIQLELGSSATDYEPYNGYQVTVNLGGTYYGGILDVVNGVMTVDYGLATENTSGWDYSTNTTSGGLHYVELLGLSKTAGNVFCNILPINNASAWQSTTPCVQMGSNKIRVYDSFTSLNDFKTKYAGLQIVYELATPTPIQLSPTMVKALVGENHLSAPLDGQEITESKYKQMFTFDDVNAQIESTYSEGISHNSVYRGKYLGDHVTDEQWDAIGDGSFRDLYIGDYWTINGINWRIAHFNYWLGTGDVKCNTNHVVIVPYGWVSTFNMNASDDTTGGYLNSEWYTTNRHFAVENIESDFGASHILSHRNFFSDAVSDGHASHGMWVDSTVDLMNEIMVCGSLVGSYSGKYYEVGCDKFQLALFKYNPPSARMDVSYWLRGVSTASSFVAMGNFGLLDGFTASQILKIRPVFAIKK